MNTKAKFLSTAGFGIIEAMVALLILGMGIYGLTSISDQISMESVRSRKLPTMIQLESGLGNAVNREYNYRLIDKTVPATLATFNSLELLGADGITYGKVGTPTYFTPDAEVCNGPAKFCIIRVDVQPVTVPGGGFGISYRISDLSGSQMGQRIASFGDASDPLDDYKWIIPSEFYAADSTTDCDASSIFLRGFSPQTGKAVCWNKNNACNDGEYVQSITFDDSGAVGKYTQNCKALKKTTCPPGYALRGLNPSLLEYDPLLSLGSPITVGECVFIYADQIDQINGVCPTPEYTPIAGNKCQIVNSYRVKDATAQ